MTATVVVSREGLLGVIESLMRKPSAHRHHADKLSPTSSAPLVLERSILIGLLHPQILTLLILLKTTVNVPIDHTIHGVYGRKVNHRKNVLNFSDVNFGSIHF